MHQYDLLMGTGIDEALLERKALADTQPQSRDRLSYQPQAD